MLPRVGSALAQFVPPVASSNQKSVTISKDPPPRDFQQFKNKSKRDTSGQETPQHTAPDPAKIDSTPPTSGILPSVATSFLQIFHALQNRKGKLIRWLGVRTYLTDARKQKKGGRFRKGTMLDEKAE